VYCAKAHHPTEIRNLVKIYGWNWKRHYDLSFQKRALPVAPCERTCMKSETRVAISSEKESDVELPNSCLSVQSNSLTEFCSRGNQGEAFTKTDMEFKSSDVILNSPSMILPSPVLYGVASNISDLMSDMVLDDEVSSYIQLYNTEMIRSTSDSMKLNYDSPVRPLFSEYKSGSLGTPFHLQNSSQSSLDSNFSNPIRDLKSFESNSSRTNWTMDIKPSTGAKVERPPLGRDSSSKSLFADLDHEGNWNDYIFGHRA